MPEQPFLFGDGWIPVTDGDPTAAALYDRLYTYVSRTPSPKEKRSMRKMSMLAATALAVMASAGISAELSAGQTSVPEARTSSAGGQHEAGQGKPVKSHSTRPGDTNGPAGWRRGSWSRWRYPKPGWSVKQGQRIARKARNVKANRRAQR